MSLPTLVHPPVDVGPWFPCTKCRKPLALDSNLFDCYFVGQTAKCADCGAEMDCWTALHDTIRRNFMLTQSYGVLGAKQTLFTFELKARQNIEIIFADHGIPKDATILSINYSAGGPEVVFPVELHGNTPNWRSPSERIVLYGVYHGDQPDFHVEVDCTVTWFRAPTKDNGWQYLVDAFREYAAGSWRNAVIPANVAAESALSVAAFEGLQACRLGVPVREIEEFLTSRATYSHQVKFILPLLADIKRIPRMPGTIASRLDRLRKVRNDLAHRGAAKQHLNHDTVAELLAGATFGFHYARFFRAQLGSDAEDLRS